MKLTSSLVALASLPAAFLLLLPLSARAQKVVASANESVTPGWWPLSGEWFCIKHRLTAPLVLTALQYRMFNYTSNPVPVDVGVFDLDPATGNPRALLGSGTAVIPLTVPGWYGTTFTTPITITTTGEYFVAVKLPATGVDLGLSRQGTITPHWHGSPANGWNGPFPSLAWPFRLYAGSHAGAYASYGTGRAGSNNVIPKILGLGWPNTTNTMEIQMSGARIAVAQAGGFALGNRIDLVTPFLTLYATLAVWTPVTLRADHPSGNGHATLSLPIPNDASLSGARLAAQAFVFDPATTYFIAYSGGLEITIGH
jgi:hypothetical protein